MIFLAVHYKKCDVKLSYRLLLSDDSGLLVINVEE